MLLEIINRRHGKPSGKKVPVQFRLLNGLTRKKVNKNAHTCCTFMQSCDSEGEPTKSPPLITALNLENPLFSLSCDLNVAFARLQLKHTKRVLRAKLSSSPSRHRRAGGGGVLRVSPHLSPPGGSRVSRRPTLKGRVISSLKYICSTPVQIAV